MSKDLRRETTRSVHSNTSVSIQISFHEPTGHHSSSTGRYYRLLPLDRHIKTRSVDSGCIYTRITHARVIVCTILHDDSKLSSAAVQIRRESGRRQTMATGLSDELLFYLSSCLHELEFGAERRDGADSACYKRAVRAQSHPGNGANIRVKARSTL